MIQVRTWFRCASLSMLPGGMELPQDCVVFGEVSLSGEVRPVGRTESRLKEAAKLKHLFEISAKAVYSDRP